LHLKKSLNFNSFPLFWEFQIYWGQPHEQDFNSTSFGYEDTTLFSSTSRSTVKQRVILREYYSK